MMEKASRHTEASTNALIPLEFLGWKMTETTTVQQEKRCVLVATIRFVSHRRLINETGFWFLPRPRASRRAQAIHRVKS